MARFMFVTFALLGWAFFELSDGKDFQPPELQASPLNELQQLADADKVQVARAATAPSQQPIVVGNAVVTPASLQTAVTSVPAPQPTRSLAVVLGEAAQSVTPEAILENAAAAEADLRVVAGSRVNVRNGPGTNYSIVASVTRGTEALVLQSPGDGWVKIKIADGGVGWMAERLLRPAG